MTGIEAVRPAPVLSRTIALVRPASAPEDDPIPAALEGDIVLFESTAHAYTTIKRSRPDLIVVCLTGDYCDGCQVLSMLASDPETSRIPVLTYTAE
jgi:CheY-like chemotaxis protein